MYRKPQGTQGQTLDPVITMVEMPDGAIVEEEVLDDPKIMDASKAAGPDGNHPAMVKLLEEVLVKDFTHLIKVLQNEGRLPAD